MIALLQRVSRASVEVAGEVKGAIGPGVLVLLGVVRSDDEAIAERLADKVAHYRILAGDDGRPDRSLLDTPDAAALVVSQFTLGANTRKGRRPDYGPTAPAAQAQSLYTTFVRALAARGVPVEQGIFGADMQVALVNDGPVTFWLEVS